MKLIKGSTNKLAEKLKGRPCPIWYPDNCPLIRVGIWVKVRVSFRVGGNKTIGPEENRPPVRVRAWLRVSFGAGGQLS